MSLKELREAKLRGDFGSLLAEVLIADHFLSRGLRVSKSSSGSGRNPDLEVVANGFTTTIEVYSPRSWQWRDDWLNDVTDALKNADVPYAFVATVDVMVNGLLVDGALLEDMVLRTGQGVLGRLIADLEGLDERQTGAAWRYDHAGGEMTTTVKFEEVKPETTGLMRLIGIGGPGNAYQAGVEFDALVAKIREKAGRRQAAGGDADVRGLAVDVSRTGLDYLLERGRLSFDASSGLDLDDVDLDFVALTLPKRGKDGPRRGVRASVIFEDTRVRLDQIGQLFDLSTA